jgi:hypothetical protein
MRDITDHDRKRFIEEMNKKWQKRFRNYKRWLDDFERDDSSDEFDKSWVYPEGKI